MYGHFKTIHGITNREIIDAAKLLDFNTDNFPAEQELGEDIRQELVEQASKAVDKIVTNVPKKEEFYQERQKYWDKREKVIDERWEETKKWQQEVLDELRYISNVLGVPRKEGEQQRQSEEWDT